MAALSNDIKLAYKYINLLLSWFSTYDVYYGQIPGMKLFLYVDTHLTLDMFSVKEQDDDCVYVYCDLNKLKVTEDDLSIVDNNGKTEPYDPIKHGGKFHPTIKIKESKPLVVFAFNKYTRLARSFKYIIGGKSGAITGNEYKNRFNVIVDDWNAMRDFVHDLEFITELSTMVECLVDIKLY